MNVLRNELCQETPWRGINTEGFALDTHSPQPPYVAHPHLPASHSLSPAGYLLHAPAWLWWMSNDLKLLYWLLFMVQSAFRPSPPGCPVETWTLHVQIEFVIFCPLLEWSIPAWISQGCPSSSLPPPMPIPYPSSVCPSPPCLHTAQPCSGSPSICALALVWTQHSLLCLLVWLQQRWR